MNKHTRKLQFSKKEKMKIWERDRGQCFFCQRRYHMESRSPMLYGILDIMHYINRSQGGLGIAENGVLGCRYHHGLLDNGHLGLRPEMLSLMREYLERRYPGWKEEDLYYRKGKI